MVEYNSIIWNPHLLCDIDKVESVQRKFTKSLNGMFNHSYIERLALLNLESLEVRRIKADLIFLYKIINKLVEIQQNDYFTFNTMQTRGHNFKINVEYSRVNCRKYFFINRVVPIWNALHVNIVNSESLNIFKNALNECDLDRYCRGRAYTAS